MAIKGIVEALIGKSSALIQAGKFGKALDLLVRATTYMNLLHPDLAQWMIMEGYRKVLSRDVLSLKEREVLNVAILTTLGWGDSYIHI